MKTCHKCKQQKDPEDFPVNRARKDGRSETCLVCKREYNRVHYERNKKYYVDKAQKAKDIVRDWFAEYKVTLACVKCGQNHPATLQFHHDDPTQKEMGISDAICKGLSLSKIKEEIEKCTVLCANCHFIHHWDERHAR